MYRIPSLASCITLVQALSVVVPVHAQPGMVLSHQKISDTTGGFTGFLDNLDFFGYSVASLGDLDGDGISDLAVAAPTDGDGGTFRGAVWVLFLDTDGTVKSHQKISDTEGGFTGILDDGDFFGISVASLGDLDADGVGDLAVGAIGDDDGGNVRGAVWILFLNTDGTVKSHQKISDTEGGFTGILDDDDFFGRSVASLGDLDGDGRGELAVGAALDDDGGFNHGAVWVLFLEQDGTVKSEQKISDTQGGFTGMLDDSDFFGTSIASLGDLDGDSVGDLAVGAHRDDDGSDGPCDDSILCNRGAVWVLFLDPDGTVKSHQKISDTEGGFTGILDDLDHFGWSVASLGDLDGDGVGDLAVGAINDNDGGDFTGAVWVLFLNADGTVKSHHKISDTEGGFTGILNEADHFGWSVGSLGDLDGDGVGDLAVGAAGDDDGGTDHGAVWVLFLDGVSSDCPADEDGGVTMCHVPPGNPDNAHTITVGANAVPAHLAHGDVCGPCEDDDGSRLGDKSDGNQDVCSTDLDDSGDVGAVDLAELLGAWGQNPGHPADLDGDGDVAAFDLAILLGNWGPCP